MNIYKPINIKSCPNICIKTGISPKSKNAKIVAPTGSNKLHVDTAYAGKYFNAQLNTVCPNMVQKKARAKNIA